MALCLLIKDKDEVLCIALADCHVAHMLENPKNYKNKNLNLTDNIAKNKWNKQKSSFCIADESKFLCTVGFGLMSQYSHV